MGKTYKDSFSSKRNKRLKIKNKRRFIREFDDKEDDELFNEIGITHTTTRSEVSIETTNIGLKRGE